MKNYFINKGLLLHVRALLIWMVGVGVFMIHQIMEKGLQVHIFWMDNWLDPFLFPIILFPLLRWERQLISGIQPYIFSWFETFALVLAAILFSEVVLPFISIRFIMDPMDMIAIIMGALIFHWFVQ